MINEVSNKVSSGDIKLSKMNTRLNDVQTKLEENCIMPAGPQEDKDEESKKQKEEKMLNDILDLQSKIGRITNDFSVLTATVKTSSGQVDDKIKNKADLESINDLESTIIIQSKYTKTLTKQAAYSTESSLIEMRSKLSSRLCTIKLRS